MGSLGERRQRRLAGAAAAPPPSSLRPSTRDAREKSWVRGELGFFFRRFRRPPAGRDAPLKPIGAQVPCRFRSGRRVARSIEIALIGIGFLSRRDLIARCHPPSPKGGRLPPFDGLRCKPESIASPAAVMPIRALRGVVDARLAVRHNYGRAVRWRRMVARLRQQQLTKPNVMPTKRALAPVPGGVESSVADFRQQDAVRDQCRHSFERSPTVRKRLSVGFVEAWAKKRHPHLLNSPMIFVFASVLKCKLKPTTAADVSTFTSSLSAFTANTVKR
jgi:hypothetical protein